MPIQKITSGIIQDGAVAAADIVSVSNTAITGNAATAYTNATIFAANASNANNGTLAFARLPSLFIGTKTI